ncbi:MAG TPA: RES family NAD+ phosphorylase [Candidatus Baltobacteraceae bacterium]
MQLFRLARRPFTQGPGGAFGGDGAYLAGSRWNTPGRRMSFAAQSESLAILEYLVHATSDAFFDDVLLIVAELDDRYIASVDVEKLPKDWRSFPPAAGTQRIGDEWLASGATAAMLVPSAIVPRERNVLVNPQHRDYSKLKIVSTAEWGADPRLEHLR